MRDRGLIVTGLMIFLGVVTFPFWYNLGKGKRAGMPDLSLPVLEQECVAPVAVMKTSHMNLIGAWRDRAVRRNLHTYTAGNGKTYAISLTKTCLQQCHNSKAAFCDRCHAYNGVPDPYCWDCHVDSRPGRAAQPPTGDGSTGEENGRR